MPTVIDSLIVTLGLDPKNFNDGQKKTSETWLKTVVGFQKGGKQVEESSKRAAETVNLITRRVLELFAVITGSRAISEFASQIISADAALGRLASNLGESPQRLSEMQNASERFGGSAEATASMLERVNKQLFDLNRNGKALPDEFYKLQAWTGMQVDTRHGADRYLSDVAASLKKLHDLRPADAHIVAQALGLDPGTETAMNKMGRGYKAYLDSLKDLAPTDGAIAAAQRLQTSWIELRQQIIALANAVLDKLGPVLIDAAQKMSDWIEKNKDWIQTGIVDAVKKFVDLLGRIDWPAVGKGLENFATGAKDVVDAVGGIKNATEILFGLWLGAKFLRVLANMRLLAGGGAAAGGAGAGAAAGMGLLGTLATGVGLLFAGAAGIKWGGSHLRADPHAGDHGTIGNFLLKHLRKSSDTTVDGKTVSRSNPLPVTISDQKSEGGGFWSNLVSGIASAFGGGGGSSAGKLGADAGGMVGGPQSSSSGTKGWWTPERQAHAYQRLRDEAGFSDAGARAAVSRWATVEATGGPSSSNNIGGGHYGIAQWSKSRGGSVWGNPDFDGQLSLAIKEFNSNEKRAGDLLRKAATDSEAAVGMSSYERGEGFNSWTGMDNFTSKTYRGMKGINTGAKGAALSNISSTHNATTSNSSVEAHIGSVNVNTQATDARGIASDINDALSRRLFTAQANSGLA